MRFSFTFFILFYFVSVLCDFLSHEKSHAPIKSSDPKSDAPKTRNPNRSHQQNSRTANCPPPQKLANCRPPPSPQPLRWHNLPMPSEPPPPSGSRATRPSTPPPDTAPRNASGIGDTVGRCPQPWVLVFSLFRWTHLSTDEEVHPHCLTMRHRFITKKNIPCFRISTRKLMYKCHCFIQFLNTPSPAFYTSLAAPLSERHRSRFTRMPGLFPRQI